jgi:hypothetical protein
MLKKKKDENRGLCPFLGLKPCNENCVFFRSGVRYTELNGEAFPFKECAFNIIADNLESMHNRTYMLQKEVGETKNTIAMKILSDIGVGTMEETAKVALKTLGLDDSLKNQKRIENK